MTSLPLTEKQRRGSLLRGLGQNRLWPASSQDGSLTYGSQSTVVAPASGWAWLSQLARRMAEASSVEQAITALLECLRDSLRTHEALVVCSLDGSNHRAFLLSQTADRCDSWDVRLDDTEAGRAQFSATSGAYERIIVAEFERRIPGNAAMDGMRWFTPLSLPAPGWGGLIMRLGRGALSDDERDLVALALQITAGALGRLVVRKENQRLHDALEHSRTSLVAAQQRIAHTEGLATIGELVSAVAHELNNPLTSVVGYAELVRSAGVSEETLADLETIDREARRCQRIVQNLLSLTRARRQKAGPILIDELIQRSLELKAYALRLDDICVELDLQTDLPPVVAHAFKIQQVLLNLINNAHEAMASRRAKGLLRISACLADGQWVRVSVEDDGPGIAPYLVPRIFEPFFTTKEQGTGLGLALSRQIAEECGGRLWLDAQKAPGARFVLDLPISTQRWHPDIPQPMQQNAFPRTKAAVLVVDDEKDVLEVICRILRSIGYQVANARDGAEAMQRLAESVYDLLIMDVKMPGITGRELYQFIRERYPSLAERVIFTTGDTASTQTVRWLESTGCQVLEKPFDIAQLSEVVIRTLGQSLSSPSAPQVD
jgi:signal transduction histidine kinase/CheY-like chemotaxis protein